MRLTQHTRLGAETHSRRADGRQGAVHRSGARTGDDTSPHIGPEAGAGAAGRAAAVDGRRLADEYSAGTLLATDIRTAYVLINHFRHHALRLVGVSEDTDNLVTIIGIWLLADSVVSGARLLRKASHGPSVADWLMGAASLREVVCTIAGPGSRKTPALGIVLTAGVVAGMGRAAGVRAIHGAKTSSQRMSSGFHNRYGYVVDSGHARERRARAAGAGAGRDAVTSPARHGADGAARLGGATVSTANAAAET